MGIYYIFTMSTSPSTSHSASTTLESRSACILIASHISNPKRIEHLIECLVSIMQQTIPIPIYLSISFENTEYREQFAIKYSEMPILHVADLSILIRDKKTPQMRHIHDLIQYIEPFHNWVMFCDDDDTYEPTRVFAFLQATVNALREVSEKMPDHEFVGLYESPNRKNHKEQRHEYWCYMVHMKILKRFYDVVSQYEDVMDNKCCDVLFAEYLRRLTNHYIFGALNDDLYHYRVDDNSDSVTGVIKTKNKVVRRAREITDSNRQECIDELNEYLDDEIDIFIHDTYLRTLVGCSFDEILQAEFKSEYVILDSIKREHVQKIRDSHEYLKAICNLIYDTKI